MDIGKSDKTIINAEQKLVKDLTNCTDLDIEFNRLGWTSRVYIVAKDKFVFKFPRSKKVRREYEQEVKILKVLENIESNIKTPKICWIGDNYDYISYKGIAGQTLELVIDKLNTIEKTNIGQKIGKFLIQLHSLKLIGVPTVTIQDEILQFQKSYQSLLPVITNRFTNNEKTKLNKLIFKKFPVIISKLGNTSVLCHGDLGYWNLILNDSNEIGIIDFGDIGYYDKSKDFLGMEDEEILNSALLVYGDNKILRQKIIIRKKVLPFLDLIYYVENKNEQMITRTLEKIKTSIYNINHKHNQ